MKKILLICLLTVLAWSNTLSEIRSSKVLRVGVANYIPPFSKLENGKFVGFEVDIANKVGERIFGKNGGKIELVGMDIEERIPALVNNKVDVVIDSMSVVKERKKYVDFTTPYFSVDLSVLTNKDDHVSSIGDLKGKKILVIKGTTGHKALMGKSNYQIAFCANNKECYQKVKNKEAIGYMTNNTMLLTFAVLDSDVELGVRQFGPSYMISMAVKKGNKELLEFLNKQIISFSKDGLFKNSFEKELNPFYKGLAEPKYFLLDDLYKILGNM